jgi:predicted ferric reductase
MKPGRIVWLLVYFLSPLIPMYLIMGATPWNTSDPVYLLSLFTGIFAYCWLVNQFILAARPKFLEVLFGADRLYRFHGLMAVISIGLAFIHKQLKEFLTGNEPIQGEIAFILFIITAVFSLIMLMNTFLQKWKPISETRKFLTTRLGLKFNRVVLLHNLTTIATLVLVVHVLASSAARASATVRAFYGGYFALGAGFYLFHKFLRPWLLDRKRYEVTRVIQESPNIRTIQFKRNGEKVFTYKPGQFLFFTPFSNGVSPEPHPFSISSSPSRNDEINLTIKELGDFTASLGNVRPGDKAHLDGPYGVFSYLNLPVDREIIFITGGIGITPILSMLRYMADVDPGHIVTLLWGVNTPQDMICREELEGLHVALPYFKFIPVVAFDNTWQGEQGFIDQEKIRRLALADGEIRSKDFFLCGPPAMMDILLSHLQALQIPKQNIHFERFAL